MSLSLVSYIDLPPHRATGGFDHADTHAPTDRLYVAYTSNDSIDVIDCARDRYVESLPGFTGVAGALVSEPANLIFTSNRGENTVSMFAPGAEHRAYKIGVGVKPNGLAFDPRRGLLISANVGDVSIPNSYSVSVVDVGRREQIADIKVSGRTYQQYYNEVRTHLSLQKDAPLARHSEIWPRALHPTLGRTTPSVCSSLSFRQRQEG